MRASGFGRVLASHPWTPGVMVARQSPKLSVKVRSLWSLPGFLAVFGGLAEWFNASALKALEEFLLREFESHTRRHFQSSLMLFLNAWPGVPGRNGFLQIRDGRLTQGSKM